MVKKMNGEVIKITVPMVFDKKVITALTGKTFKDQGEYQDYCQDIMYRMLKTACESSAIHYMMEVEVIN